MTSAARLTLATGSLIGLGAAGAYYATQMALRGHTVADGIGLLVPALAAGLTALLVSAIWRQSRRATHTVCRQLDQMMRSGQIGLVMTQRTEDLGGVVRALNRFLTHAKGQLDQLRAANRELQIQSRIADAEKQQVEAVIFSISDAVLVTNRFDELMLANEAAEELLGFRLAGAARRTIDQVLGDPVLARLVRETHSHGARAGRRVVEHAVRVGGQERTHNVTLSCVIGPGEEVAGVVAVLHDVTREKEIAKMKTDFVSNVSHELRTPLASIKAYVEMLMDGEADDEATRREFLEIISGEADRLGRLIDNILNLSRIESGLVKVVKEPLNLSAVAKEVVEVARPQARGKSITLEERLAPVTHQIEADRDMICQAVMNLVSNAIKYTPDGGTVEVATFIDEAAGRAVCEVRDSGVGIPAEDLPHVFDKFYRVQANSRMAKGTGLGLSLVKHVIETVHGGSLGVQSRAGQGSTFRFELPLCG